MSHIKVVGMAEGLQSVFSPLDVMVFYTLEKLSGPDPRPLSFSANNGCHVLFECGDTQFQLLREVFQQTTLLVQKQSEP